MMSNEEARTWTKANTQATSTMTLARIAQDREDLDRQQSAAVLDARLAGMTWAQIGRALGVSAQAVQKRYGPSTSSSQGIPDADLDALIVRTVTEAEHSAPEVS